MRCFRCRFSRMSKSTNDFAQKLIAFTKVCKSTHPLETQTHPNSLARSLARLLSLFSLCLNRRTCGSWYNHTHVKRQTLKYAYGERMAKKMGTRFAKREIVCGATNIIAKNSENSIFFFRCQMQCTLHDLQINWNFANSKGI